MLALGVLDFHPIQYHAPLYQRLTRRGKVNLSVMFLRDWGYRTVVDPAFGVPISWNIDLLSGYDYTFLSSADVRTRNLTRVGALAKWLRSCDIVVIHGHSDPWMLSAAAICRAFRVPYLLRGDSAPHGRSTGVRRRLRDVVARTMVSGSAGGLAVGQLNEEFYRKYRAPRVTFAPHSVDNDRFACAPPVDRSDLLATLGLDDSRPVLMFCGKLHARKRPLDLTAAVKRLPQEVTTIFVGDGVLAGLVKAELRQGSGAVTGFVNQAELPSYYHAADILVLPSEAEPWGLVVNEAMAAGVLPVVSDRVGAAPDLVEGVGEVYPCGDVPGLAAALDSALVRIKDPALPGLLREHVARYGLDRTAAGFERGALVATNS